MAMSERPLDDRPDEVDLRLEILRVSDGDGEVADIVLGTLLEYRKRGDHGID
jgi:hypothetical protein